ncbi:MAG: hypothetical protein H8E16_14215 [Flavobacteriales bacterium]|nr:hypothetical protein [Flavobacteriales bacterium]
MDLKNYNNFVNEEIDDFYEDLENSNKKLKLFATFNKSKLKDVKTSFSIPVPKKKFQPKVKGYKKINKDKGIF